MADVEVLIIGAGFSGLCMAIKLLQAGHQSFLLLEKHADLGGTWYLNRYPGCSCDVPSHLFSFSFHPNPSWSSMYARSPEIHRYIKACALHYGVLPYIRFNTPAISAVWDAASALWRVEVGSSDHPSCLHVGDAHKPGDAVTSTISARFLVRAVGLLHVPKYPDIKGREKFAGPAFHSSLWDSSISLEGKTVAVIGTGASSIQMVPEIATVAKKLYVFQRTPGWIIPKTADVSIPLRCRQLFARFPLLMWLFWCLLFLRQELLVWGFVGGKAARRVMEWAATRHMQGAIKHPDLRKKLQPNFEIGCKRILLSNDCYPALTRPNVDLITDPILEIDENSLRVSAGGQNISRHEVDIIIYATGFNLVPKLHTVGTSGLEYNEAGFSSLLGTTKLGFPNLFVLSGYNTGTGHTSQLLMIEAQVRYVLSCLGLKRGLFRSIEPHASAQRQYQDLLACRFPKTVWNSGGCNSWYLDSSTGHNYTLWPGSTLEFMYRSWSAKPSDYCIQ